MKEIFYFTNKILGKRKALVFLFFFFLDDFETIVSFGIAILNKLSFFKGYLQTRSCNPINECFVLCYPESHCSVLYFVSSSFA